MESGPSLGLLTRRLAECPPEFLLPPGAGEKGTIHVRAVVADLLRDLGAEVVGPADTETFAPGERWTAPAQQLVMVASWLLHDDWFIARGTFAWAARDWMASGLHELAAIVRPPSFVRDPDRREELVRLSLAALGFFPEGEVEAQAADRLTSLSTVERKRVIDATREAREHAKRVREAMQRKAAEEAASRYGRNLPRRRPWRPVSVMRSPSRPKFALARRAATRRARRPP
jgi:hypothetical protein